MSGPFGRPRPSAPPDSARTYVHGHPRFGSNPPVPVANPDLAPYPVAPKAEPQMSKPDNNTMPTQQTAPAAPAKKQGNTAPSGK